jgi:hypothetical protein
MDSSESRVVGCRSFELYICSLVTHSDSLLHESLCLCPCPGPDKEAYYHEMFLRGKRFLAGRIPRVSIKGKGPRKADSTDSCPDFYRLPPLDTTATTNMSQGPIAAHVRTLLGSTPPTRLTNHRAELATVHAPSNAAVSAALASQDPPSSLFLNGPTINGSSLWPCLDSTNPHWAFAQSHPAGRLETMPGASAPPLAPLPLTADQSFLLQVIANRRRADAAAAANPFWLEQQQHQHDQQALLSGLYSNSRYPNGWPGWLDPRNPGQWP